MKIPLTFACLLFPLLAMTCGAEPPNTATASAASGTTIQGTATIELKKGTVQYLNGLGIALIPEDAYAEIKKIRNERWLLRASRANFDDGFHNLDLDAIGGTAVNRALSTTKADTTGKYAFKNVAPGSYRLYAQYRSHYAVAYWLIPVKIKPAQQDLTVNIGTANLEEAYNLFK